MFRREEDAKGCLGEGREAEITGRVRVGGLGDRGVEGGKGCHVCVYRRQGLHTHALAEGDTHLPASSCYHIGA